MKTFKRIIGWKYFYLVFYALISLAILGPLLQPEIILTLDMRIGPNIDFNSLFYGTNPRVDAVMRLPVNLSLWLASKVAPFWLWQKILFFLVFFLAGVGAHRLFPIKGTASYFAGLLYMINPFTYVRFLAGQWVILAVYALIPFAVKAFIDLLEVRNKRNAVKVAILSTLVGVMYGHGFLLLFLALLIILIVRILIYRQKSLIIDTIKFLGISAAIFIALNAYWLFPILTAKETIVEQIRQQDLFYFAPKPVSHLGIMFDTASMYGFWRGGYIYTKDILPFWWLLFVFIMFLAVYGFISGLTDNKHRWIILAFASIGTASLLLAVGVASNLTRPLFELLWEYIPFFTVFRDSHKFVALLCLSYAYLGALGVNEIINTLRQQGVKVVKIGVMALVGVALLTPLAYSFTIFGFYGQLRVTDYPKEWYEVNEYLNQDKDDFTVLFLPWHAFMDYEWLPNRDKRLGNPARAFFNKQIIQGDNIEMPGIYSQSTNPISKYIEFLLGKGRKVSNLGELLAPLNVKYVILVNEADYETYDFLYKQEDLTVELEKPGVTLFRNRYPTAKVYGVESVIDISSLDEYLELSQTQNVMEHLYIIEAGVDGSPPKIRSRFEPPAIESINYLEKVTVKYQVEVTSHQYIVFTVPQNVNTYNWEYDGKKAMKNLGFMPAFKSSPDGGKVAYLRFYQVYLPSYIISLITLITLAFIAGYSLKKGL